MTTSRSKNRPERRTNKKGRRSGSPRFVKFDHYILECDAFKSLKPTPRALLLLLQKRYNGNNNGQIGLSVRYAADELHISKDTVSKCLHELVDKGFIKRRLNGSFNYKSRHASEWELTWEDCDGQTATKEFMRWKQKNPVPK